MSNTDNPNGFIPSGSLDGGESYVKIMTKLAASGTAVGRFDPVKLKGTQNNIIQASAATATYGLSLNYGALSTLTTHAVLVLTNQVLASAQEDGNAGVDSEGLNCAFLVGAANTTTGQSIAEIDSSEVATTSTLDLKLFKVAPFADNDGTASNARWLVTFNNVTMGQKTVGVA